jgi:hypothetical protein
LTALEAIAKLQERKAEPVEIFLFLANHIHELKLADGCSVVDGTDCRKLFEELAQAMRAFGPRNPSPEKTQVLPQPRYPIARLGSDLCHRCGHVHKDKICGEKMGPSEQDECPCEEAVTA